MAMNKGNFIYEVIAHGEDVPEQVIADALSAIGLQVSSQNKEESLYAVVNKLPNNDTNFAERCRSYLYQPMRIPESWEYMDEEIYFWLKDHIGTLCTSSIADTAEDILKHIEPYCTTPEAERFTADLLRCVCAWKGNKS